MPHPGQDPPLSRVLGSHARGFKAFQAFVLGFAKGAACPHLRTFSTPLWLLFSLNTGVTNQIPVDFCTMHVTSASTLLLGYR